MSPSIALPSTEELKDFLRIYLDDLIIDEYSSAINHYVFQVKGRDEDTSVPLNRKEIKLGTLLHILKSAGIDQKEYRRLAGDKKKLKKYIKEGKKRHRASGGG